MSTDGEEPAVAVGYRGETVEFDFNFNLQIPHPVDIMPLRFFVRTMSQLREITDAAGFAIRREPTRPADAEAQPEFAISMLQSQPPLGAIDPVLAMRNRPLVAFWRSATAEAALDIIQHVFTQDRRDNDAARFTIDLRELIRNEQPIEPPASDPSMDRELRSIDLSEPGEQPRRHPTSLSPRDYADNLAVFPSGGPPPERPGSLAYWIRTSRDDQGRSISSNRAMQAQLAAQQDRTAGNADTQLLTSILTAAGISRDDLDRLRGSRTARDYAGRVRSDAYDAAVGTAISARTPAAESGIATAAVATSPQISADDVRRYPPGDVGGGVRPADPIAVHPRDDDEPGSRSGPY